MTRFLVDAHRIRAFGWHDMGRVGFVARNPVNTYVPLNGHCELDRSPAQLAT
jgi:hypothetical protein